ncbi:MAG: hypothetical protein IKI99_03305 [Firmicutes bacterium]|nr:hypothetical protein [Bacillota bacterium]
MKFQIEESLVRDAAEERFFRICSFNLAEAGQRKMETAAYRVRTHLQQRMDIRATVRFWERSVLTDTRLQLGDVALCCDAFSRIPADAVKGAYSYLLTIGDTGMEEEVSIMTELYHDVWGTAYVESAMEVLRKRLLQALPAENLHLSESFGPGYYGMTMEEGAKIYGLLDGAAVGVEQKSSGLLMPEKSCQGLILVYDRDDIRMPRACESCLGAKGGCRFCDKGNVKE